MADVGGLVVVHLESVAVKVVIVVRLHRGSKV